MTIHERIWVEHNSARIALTRWGAPDASRPPALLSHGTGFVAEVWDEVASELAADYTVYGVDRRGHGASHKPAANQYHFLDFAEDVCAVIRALDLTNIYGIGHSAGATDLLLAAKMLPGRFSRLFVMEPTIMDPRAARIQGTPLSERGSAGVQGVLRRLAEFESAAAVFKRYRAAPAFADWSERALWSYVTHGFEVLADGRVRLHCAPQFEAAILRPIYEAMEQVYTGDERGNPFLWLPDVDCPVRVATAEKSLAIYKDMSSRAISLLPNVSEWTFQGVGHCVAQEAPGLVLQAIRAFTETSSLNNDSTGPAPQYRE